MSVIGVEHILRYNFTPPLTFTDRTGRTKFAFTPNRNFFYRMASFTYE